MDDRKTLELTLERAKLTLHMLETQAAGYTALTRPPHLQIELEEKHNEVASLEARLGLLTGRGAGVPDNLPPKPAIFVGRKDEIARCLEALLPEERGWGVTIDGLGGMGKTTLALEVAHLAREQAAFDAYAFVSAKTSRLTPDGVREETLAATSLDAFIREFARILGCEAVCQTPDATERRKGLLEALRGRRALLIWDNLETLIAEERDLIAEFLRKLPGANKAILTSRRRTGESALTLRLDKLTEPEAFALMDALGRRQPRIAGELRAAGEATRRALYAAAGGNPLVLDFALGQVAGKGLTLPQAVARVEDADRSGDLYGFLFADAARDLRAADRTVLSALSSFQTPAAPAALVDVTGLTPNAVSDALERLVTLSLVNDLPGGRYGLHPLTRTYVRAALNGERKTGSAQPVIQLDPAARRKALRYWVDYAQKYGGSGKDAYQTFEKLQAEWPNLEAAAGELWTLTGLPGALKDTEAAKMLNDLTVALKQFLWFRGYWDERRHLSEQAYAANIACKVWRDAGWRAYDVAWIHYQRSETELAVVWAERMAEAMELNGERRDRAAASQLHGLVAQQRKDYPEAERRYTESLATFRDLGAGAAQATVLSNLGSVARARKDYDRAEITHRKLLALAEKLGNKERQASSVGNLGLLALECNRPAEARPLFERALALGREVGREDLVGDALWGLARVLEEEGRCAEALPLAEESLRIYERLRHGNVEESRALVARLRERAVHE